MNQLVPGKENLKLGIQNLPAKLLQFSLTLPNPMDSSLRGSSVHGFLHARILEWVALSSSRGPSYPRNQASVSCIAGRFFTSEPLEKTAGVQRSPPFSAFKVFLQKYANKLQLTKKVETSTSNINYS